MEWESAKRSKDFSDALKRVTGEIPRMEVVYKKAARVLENYNVINGEG